MVNLLEGLTDFFGGWGLNSPESKSENNKKWYDFSFLEDEEEKSAFDTAKKEAESDDGLQLEENVSSSHSSSLDTAKVKYGLNQTGYYDGDASTIPNQQMIDGVKEFQKDNNLHVDGMLKPKGETITTMNNKMKDFYATKKYESGTEKGEKEYIRWQLKQNEKERAAALAPKPKPKPKKEDNWFSFKPLNKSAEKKESEYSSNSLLRYPEPEPIKTSAEQIRDEKSHEQQSLNLLERKQGEALISSPKPEFNSNNLLEKKTSGMYDRSSHGLISREFETKHNPKAIGNDTTGGQSYGDYQIETKSGTMKDFLKYMQKKPKYKNYYDTLEKAGGYNSALAGEDHFQNVWRGLAEDDNFRQAQHDFIIDNKYNKVLNGINDIKGLDVDKRNNLLKELIISTSVQHGETGGKNVIHAALGYDASNLSDEEIIAKIYDERSNVDRWFSKSTDKTKKSLKQRFADEKKQIINLLKKRKNN